MKLDPKGRRSRFAKQRQPKAKAIILNESDRALFEAIHRHGPLPSNYIYEFTKHLRRKAHKDRLTKLFHGTLEGTYYLEKPEQQFRSFFADCAFLVYDLAPRAIAEHGKLPQQPDRSDPFLHRLMTACVTASIELACTKLGYRFIPMSEILAKKESSLGIPLSGLDRKTLIPDGLFGIEYTSGFYFYALEIDRNTESLQRKDLDQTAYGRKLEGYIDILSRKAFTDHWGVPNLAVLTVTTNPTHAKNMIDFYQKLGAAKFAHRFLFQTAPDFGPNWRVPVIMEYLINDPWMRADGKPFSLNTA